MLSCVLGQKSADTLTDSMCLDILCRGGEKELSQKLDFLGPNLIHSVKMEMLTIFLNVRCHFLSARSNNVYSFKIKVCLIQAQGKLEFFRKKKKKHICFMSLGLCLLLTSERHFNTEHWLLNQTESS